MTVPNFIQEAQHRERDSRVVIQLERQFRGRVQIQPDPTVHLEDFKATPL